MLQCFLIHCYILPLLEELAAESEILNDGSRAIAPELSEGASRPLVSEKDPEIRHRAMKQIVKVAEEKVMDEKRPQVTNREVSEIVAKVKGRDVTVFLAWRRDLPTRTYAGRRFW